MHPRYQKLHIEIEKNINSISSNHFDEEITSKLIVYIEKFVYDSQIYDYRINSNYPDTVVYIQYQKGGEIYDILPLRTQRVKKLIKLNDIT
jgi:hypothetical protein